jgi:hypothetical protein
MSLRNALGSASVVAMAVFAVSACSSDPSDPGSASDVAKQAGCSEIHDDTVPAAWSTYDQAVTCVLDGAHLRVYWSPDDQAEECVDGDHEACTEAMRAFRPAS